MNSTAYENLLRDVLDHGTQKGDRTGTGTLSVFGRQIRYDLSEGFPLITSKKVPFRVLAEELLWFLQGDGNIRPLLEKNVHIWTEWAFKPYMAEADMTVPEVNSPEWKRLLKQFEQDIVADEDFAMKYGDLGPVYGVQWRSWPTPDGSHVDQIQRLIDDIRRNPNSRRLMVSAWNVAEVDKMALPPCHALFQFYVADGKLSCQLYQRSSDMFLGVPFNIASYALLTHMIAQQCDLGVGEFIWTSGDTHIYNNHVEQVREQLCREVRPLPRLVIKRRPETIFDYTFEDFEVIGYDPHSAIKGEVAV